MADDRAGERRAGAGAGGRVGLGAAALLARMGLVLADEPTGNLDSASGGEIVGLLEELNAEGTTILVITHDREVASRAQRRVELLDGRVVGQ